MTRYVVSIEGKNTLEIQKTKPKGNRTLKRMIALLMMFALTLAAFAACGTRDQAEPTDTDPTPLAGTAAQAELPQADVAKADGLDAFTGIWADTASGRGVVTITARGEGCDIKINWGDSANVYNLWTMTATLENGELRYNDCVSTVRTYETEDKYTDEVQSQNGAGRFYLDGGQNLIWEAEGADEGVAFMNVG